MTQYWYAMRSKPNKESFLAHQLAAYGIEYFYPCIRVTPVNSRSRKMRPYFPNYLFVHVDLEIINMSTLDWMPGASGLVNFGGEHPSVPDHLILALERQINLIETESRELMANMKKGDLVIVQNGPFAGYEAIFDMRLSGRDRVRVLLNFLQGRFVPVELERGQIQRLKHP
jgi:transcription antitermination factor NusG